MIVKPSRPGATGLVVVAALMAAHLASYVLPAFGWRKDRVEELFANLQRAAEGGDPDVGGTKSAQ